MAAVGRQPRLLVLRALGLGDLLTAVPALRALADAFPGYRRVLACPRALEPLVRLTEAIDEILDTGPLQPVDANLRGIEVAVNLHGRGPQSHRLLQALAPGRLIAFANVEAGFPDGPNWRPGEHEVVRWCRLLDESGVPADPSRLDLRPPTVEVPDRARGATVVHPGAASRARRWPVERFAAVARYELERGRRVLVTGSADERRLAEQVADLAALPRDAVLAGTTQLEQLAGVVAAADRVVCGDTGLAHLATAMGTPSLVLFGPTSPAEWGPPPDRPGHRAIWKRRAGDAHATTVDPGLLEISAGEVIAMLHADAST